MGIRYAMELAISLPKTLYFNFKVLPFKKAVKLPFFIEKDIRIGKLYKNVIDLNFEANRFDIQIGTKYMDGVPELTKGFISFSPESKIVFKGKAIFSYGITMRTIGKSSIIVGDDFYCNKNCEIVARESIEFGTSNLLGWCVSVRDSDGETHRLFKQSKETCLKKRIKTGNHVWLCARSSLMKGASIEDDCVVAYGACVTKAFSEKNVILGGTPAHILEKNIKWER